jgi:dihydrofolate reductase
MRSVTYSMSVSLDGYIVGPNGDFDWGAPDEEVFRFWIDEIREVGVHLMGRRLYETMLYWETADQDHSLDDAELEWAAIWKPLPKVVFSTTLSAVRGNARLASGGLAEEIERLRAEPGRATSRSAARLSPPRPSVRLGDYRTHRRRTLDGRRRSPRRQQSKTDQQISLRNR